MRLPAQPEPEQGRQRSKRAGASKPAKQTSQMALHVQSQAAALPAGGYVDRAESKADPLLAVQVVHGPILGSHVCCTYKVQSLILGY